MLAQTSFPMENDQARDVVAPFRSSRSLWTGFGFAVIMLIGVCALAPNASHASPSHFVSAAAPRPEELNFIPPNPVLDLASGQRSTALSRASPAELTYSNPSRANLRGPLTLNMGGNVRVFRDRISSVKNTEKITSAMKLVAAAKVRRAQDVVLKSRPFSETLDQILGGLVQRLELEKIDIPLMENREVKKVGIVVFSGDRGLCGGYNSNVIKKAESRIAELKAQGVQAELITVGQKAISHFGKRETPVRMSAMCTQSPTAEQATEISDELLNSFNAGELDRIELIYTKFISMIASEPTIRTLIPLSPTGMEQEGDEIFKLVSKDGDFAIEKENAEKAAPREWVKDMIFEQAPDQLLNAILPLYITGQMLKSLQESVASELASRMSAMQSASDNAKELKNSLSQQMNRARQAAVTQELTEIVAGADAR